MLYELAHTPMPDGYGEALLPLAECKLHLRVDGDDENDLIALFRDAAIEFVERYCEVRMGPVTGLAWRAEALPAASNARVDLGVWPVTALSTIRWRDAGGADVDGTEADFRVSERGMLRPGVGKEWPGDVGGDVEVTFAAGFANGACPAPLVQAVRLMLGHLYMNREAVIVGTISGQAPLGVMAHCGPFRVMRI